MRVCGLGTGNGVQGSGLKISGFGVEFCVESVVFSVEGPHGGRQRDFMNNPEADNPYDPTVGHP